MCSQTDQHVYNDEGETSAKDEIPLWGYVGPDADIIDNGGEKPDIKEPNEGPDAEMIDVTVPVSMLWAAFESDAGDISSPSYYITNNGIHDLYVSAKLTEDASNASLGVNSTTVDLYLTDDFAKVDTIGTLYELGKLGASQTWDFDIGGYVQPSLMSATVNANGDFSDAIQPRYDLELTFDLNK